MLNRCQRRSTVASVKEAQRTLAVSSTPASTMRTETLGSSDRREAMTQPALPAPTIISVQGYYGLRRCRQPLSEPAAQAPVATQISRAQTYSHTRGRSVSGPLRGSDQTMLRNRVAKYSIAKVGLMWMLRGRRLLRVSTWFRR